MIFSRCATCWQSWSLDLITLWILETIYLKTSIVWSQKLLAGKTASGIAICMYSFHPLTQALKRGLLGTAAGCRWRAQGAPAVPSRYQPPFLRLGSASPVVMSSTFLKESRVDLEMSFSFFERPFVSLEGSSLTSLLPNFSLLAILF